MASYKIFQIYYDKLQKQSLYNSVCIDTVFNPVPDKYSFNDGYYLLENKIILEKITPEIKEDYVAVWSHKHYEKIWNFSQDSKYNKIQGKEGFINWLDNTIAKGDFDVLGFHRHMNKYHKKHMLTMAERFHKNFNTLLRNLLVKADCLDHVSLTPEFPFVTLMNYQVARTDIYLDYIENVLRPVVNVMLDKRHSDIQGWLFQDANYKGDAKNEGTLMKIGGKPYYTMHTFILERLFTLYLNTLNTKKLNCISY